MPLKYAELTASRAAPLSLYGMHAIAPALSTVLAPLSTSLKFPARLRWRPAPFRTARPSRSWRAAMLTHAECHAATSPACCRAKRAGATATSFPPRPPVAAPPAYYDAGDTRAALDYATTLQASLLTCPRVNIFTITLHAAECFDARPHSFAPRSRAATHGALAEIMKFYDVDDVTASHTGGSPKMRMAATLRRARCKARTREEARGQAGERAMIIA